MKKSWFLVGALLALAPAAFGIGRSGNGVSSSRTGFFAEFPRDFEMVESLPNARIRLRSAIIEGGGPLGFVPLFLELSDADFSLPALAELSREALPIRMKELGWVKREHSDPCVEAYLFTDESTTALALFWGGKKGLVAVGPRSANVRMAVESLLRTVQLQPGACAW